ncbi:hypothetical protein RhiirA5_500870 [Rhizophagus irregularis]|uniref:Uncharacterized protein n=1 Tax=Rhizophagus irregularis TaxID=588596 RepID=A0A2N0PK23_9GLOM|nr:hypothetical protein RhiirA5_500870 [Rhizophagus irregularis]
MLINKKYGFKYQYFTNLLSFDGILDIKRKNSIISLDRLKKHQIDTKYLIKKLTKTSYNNNEDQYNEINYDDIKGILMDFHILLGVEKMDITLKKILVVNYIEGDDEFILGNDFIRDFDVEIEDVYDKQLLRQLKFTVQLNEIDEYIHNDFDNINDEATSSISAGSNAVRKRRMKEKNVDDLTHHDDAYASSADNVAEQNNNINSRTSRTSTLKNFVETVRNTFTKHYYCMIVAFIIFLGTISSIPDERCKYSIDRTNWITNEDCEVKCLSKAYHLIFKDDVDWLITLENDAASLNTSLTSTNERCLNKLKRKSPIYDLELISDNMYNIRASYKSLLKYYGNDLWTQRERHIKDIKTIVEFSPSDWLLFFINQRKKRIDYINKLFLSISENDKNENFVNMMEDIHIELINIIDDIIKVQFELEKQQSEDNIFDCLDLLMTELNYAKLYTEKLREKNIIINHIFMKLKVDIIKILEKRNFNNDEIEIINHFLEQEQINRNIFLENI